YSLAIVYQELLTSQRPFNGNSLRQLVMQHLYNEPDLSTLPAADRPVVARALAKKPDDRYPTCKEFVSALRAAAKATAAAGAETLPPLPEADDGEKTQGPKWRQELSPDQILPAEP